MTVAVLGATLLSSVVGAFVIEKVVLEALFLIMEGWHQPRQ